MSSVVALEVASRCRACDSVVPVNRWAPAVTCGDCGRRIDLPPETWAMLLRVFAEAARGREGDEKATVVEAGTATLRCVVRRTDAHCAGCRKPLALGDAGALLEAGTMFCVGCGARATVRRAPGSAPGVELVLGEEPEKVAANATRTLPCGECGALLALDPAERTQSCPYCQASSLVPEEVWRELHPRSEVRRWFLAFAGVSAPRAAAVTWSTVSDVATDAAGNLYFVGCLDADDAETAVWCLAPDVTLRWARRSLAGLPADRARLFITGGRLAVWFPGGPVIAFLDAASGETVATYPAPGGRQPVSVATFADVTADLDGTLLALVHGEPAGGMMAHVTLVRFTSAGALVNLWPGVPPPSPPAVGDVIPLFTELQSQPRHFPGAPRLHVGWNGTLFVRGGHYDMGTWARIAPKGFVTVERAPADSTIELAVDRRGRIYLLGRGQVVALDLVGRPAWKLDTATGPAGLAGERLLVVSPDGETTLVGHGGRLRRLGAEGAALFTSEASHDADQRQRGWAAR